MKTVLNFLAAIFVCVAISVYALHLFVVIRDPRASRDAQYAVSFMMSGAFGWLAGTAFFFILRQIGKKRPPAARWVLPIFALYAVLLAAATIAFEFSKLAAGASHTAVFLIGYLPIIVALSPMGLALVFSSPFLLLVELAAFAPLIFFVAVRWFSTEPPSLGGVLEL